MRGPMTVAMPFVDCARVKRRAEYFAGPSTVRYEDAATSSVARPDAVTKVNATNIG